MDAVFSPEQLARMQATQQAHMPDACVIEHFTSGAAQDEHGKVLDDYVAGYTGPCGINFPAARYEALNGTSEPLVDARLRLPLGTVVNSTDRVRITHRFGVPELTPQTYEIVGSPGPGPSGLICKVRRVTLATAQ